MFGPRIFLEDSSNSSDSQEDFDQNPENHKKAIIKTEKEINFDTKIHSKNYSFSETSTISSTATKRLHSKEISKETEKPINPIPPSISKMMSPCEQASRSSQLRSKLFLAQKLKLMRKNEENIVIRSNSMMTRNTQNSSSINQIFENGANVISHLKDSDISAFYNKKNFAFGHTSLSNKHTFDFFEDQIVLCDNFNSFSQVCGNVNKIQEINAKNHGFDTKNDFNKGKEERIILCQAMSEPIPNIEKEALKIEKFEEKNEKNEKIEEKNEEKNDKIEKRASNYEKPRKTPEKIKRKDPVVNILDLLPSQSTKVFLTSPLSKGRILHCTIHRNKSGLNKLYPKYTMTLSSSEKFLLSSKKRGGNKTSNYIITMSPSDFDPKTGDFLGKLRANFLRTEFMIYDSGLNPKNSKATLNNVRAEYGIIFYVSFIKEFNFIKKNCYKKMNVLIPSVTNNQSYL